MRVRVLLDHLGNFPYPGYRRTIRRLKAMGVQWHLMLPFQPWRLLIQRPDLRNHRKLLVIDGEIAFTGSQNIIETPYQKRGNRRRGLHWKDYMARFEGPVVAGIDALFVTDWYTETGELLTREAAPARKSGEGDLDCQVVPSGPGFSGENNLRLFNSLVYAAQERIILVSPYFVPDDSMLYAITTAAQSGLDVQLFVSEIGDQFFVFHAQRSYYEQLLRAGVRIFRYAKPTILHAKHFTIDDQVAVIGSSNLDMRSFTLDLEISVMVRGEKFIRDLRGLEDAYREHSRELTLDEWMSRPLHRRILDHVARADGGRCSSALRYAAGDLHHLVARHDLDARAALAARRARSRAGRARASRRGRCTRRRAPRAASTIASSDGLGGRPPAGLVVDEVRDRLHRVGLGVADEADRSALDPAGRVDAGHAISLSPLA